MSELKQCPDCGNVHDVTCSDKDHVYRCDKLPIANEQSTNARADRNMRQQSSFVVDLRKREIERQNKLKENKK